MSVKLTAKQDMFCREYLKDLNATQAAIRAGYKPDNAYAIGAENLKKPQIAQHIASLKAKRAEEVRIDAAWVLARLKQIDDLDILDIIKDDMKGFRALSEWPKAWRTSVSGIDINTILSGGDKPVETLVQKIKWPDKTRNLELIGKHVDIKAFDKETTTVVTNNIMPVPTADSVEDWEVTAKAQQDKILGA